MCPAELCEDLQALARSATLFRAAFGFDRLALFSIDHPRRVIGAFAVLVLLAAPGLFRLQLRTDGHALVPPDDPAVRFDAEVRRHFGLRDPIVVVLETGRPDGLFDPGVLRRLRDLTAALEKVPGVPPGGVTSLATEKRDRVYPGTLDFRPFLDEVPETPEQMEAAFTALYACPNMRTAICRCYVVMKQVPGHQASHEEPIPSRNP